MRLVINQSTPESARPQRPPSARGQGRVTLVGAGPGDPGFLTLRAVRALQEADVILYDSLVSDEVLEFTRREARRILVGKRADRPSCRQGDIHTMMLRWARAGRHVVRLKSGDPMVFGRAGEELRVLADAGIPVAVVPGISAAQALAAALGVSLTHRDCAQSLRFVTGHSRHGGLPAEIDWAALADPAATTVIYMGARMAGQIVAHLCAQGVAASTPVAIGIALGRREERVGYARLDQLVEALAADLEHPIVLGLGQVFAEAGAQAPGWLSAGLEGAA